MDRVSVRNLFRVPAAVKIVEIVLLLVVLCIAQAGTYFPGFGGDKHLYCFGCGICVGFIIIHLVIIISYVSADNAPQPTFELVLNVIGSILFLSLSITVFVKSDRWFSSYHHVKAKLIGEGVCLLLVSICHVLDALLASRSFNN